MTKPVTNQLDETFAFTAAHLKEAKVIVSQYPVGRQASAILPLLDMAQRQNGGWLSNAAIVYIAKMLDMPEIRAFEVATFYTMFNLKPVGKNHLQVCTTTPCMLRGSGDLVDVCRDKLGIHVGESTQDGLFTLSEVECLGACVNAPIVQINDDFIEDLDVASWEKVLEDLKMGKPLRPGSVMGRQCSAPQGAHIQCEDANVTKAAAPAPKKVAAKKKSDAIPSTTARKKK